MNRNEFVADRDPEEVRTLTRLLLKFEQSKAEVARQEQASGRQPWQRSR